jgi:hypothetical protein
MAVAARRQRQEQDNGDAGHRKTAQQLLWSIVTPARQRDSRAPTSRPTKVIASTYACRASSRRRGSPTREHRRLGWSRSLPRPMHAEHHHAGVRVRPCEHMASKPVEVIVSSYGRGASSRRGGVARTRHPCQASRGCRLELSTWNIVTPALLPGRPKWSPELRMRSIVTAKAAQPCKHTARLGRPRSSCQDIHAERAPPSSTQRRTSSHVPFGACSLAHEGYSVVVLIWPPTQNKRQQTSLAKRWQG